MGTIIFIEEFRKRRCVEALLAHIGLPSYCDECGDEVGEMLLDTTDISFEEAAAAPQPPAAHAPAQILAFPPHIPAAETTPETRRKSSRRAPARRSQRD